MPQAGQPMQPGMARPQPGQPAQAREPVPPREPVWPPAPEPVRQDSVWQRSARQEAAWQDAPDMFVYRDSGEPAEPVAPPIAEEAAYWYGRPPAEPAEPAESGLAESARGPFEPFASSPAGQALAGGEPAELADPVAAEEPEDPAERHAQKLEQIKDFYLTAEAIGEQNVDKHFDQLLAQQRELISQYFKESEVIKAASAEPDQPTETEAGAGAAPADAAW
jgi:hypothetical protein